MSFAPKRPCQRPGCPELTRGSYCSRCRAVRPPSRLSAHRRGYGRHWRRYRLMFIRAHPVCEDAEGCEEPTVDVDHIIPVDGPDDPRFWDPANHQGLCHGHHSRKTAREDGGFGHSPAGRGAEILTKPGLETARPKNARGRRFFS